MTKLWWFEHWNIDERWYNNSFLEIDRPLSFWLIWASLRPTMRTCLSTPMSAQRGKGWNSQKTITRFNAPIYKQKSQLCCFMHDTSFPKWLKMMIGDMALFIGIRCKRVGLPNLHQSTIINSSLKALSSMHNINSYTPSNMPSFQICQTYTTWFDKSNSSGSSLAERIENKELYIKCQVGLRKQALAA